MFTNYFKTAFRNFFKNRVISTINILGLSVGMTATVFIFLWVQNEVTVDNYQPNNIYRISSMMKSGSDVSLWENSPRPMADAAAKNIPEVEKTAMLRVNSWGGINLNINSKLFSEKTSAWVGKSWFNIFKYQFVQGNAAAFTQNPYSIVLTESKAKKYFGYASPVGQVIQLDTVNYTVAGVVKDNPLNSSFQFDIFLQMESYLNTPGQKRYIDDWNNYNYVTFLQAQPGSSNSAMAAKLTAVVNKARNNNQINIALTPLKDMYFETGNENSATPHGNKKTTYIFALLGLLMLVTACINYVNLTTARASLREKEVSVRKIIGAEKAHLFFQFIAESLVISFCSLLVTLMLIQVMLPLFNGITEKNFQLPLTSVAMWQILLGTLVAATVLNGIYPALLLSSFKPLNVFRGRSVLKLLDGAIRKGLVVFQFALAVVLIIGTMVIYRQLHYIQSTNPGYNVAQVASMRLPYKSYAKLNDAEQATLFSSIKHELSIQPGITQACTGGDDLFDVGNYSTGNCDWDGRDTAFKPQVADLSVDEDFKKMFGLQLKSGRWFRPGKEDYKNYIINETAEASFNMRRPVIGQRFTYGGDTGRIIGVVKDFHYKSMHEKIGALVMQNNQGKDANFFVKIAAGSIPQALSGMAGVWNKFAPKAPFQYTFLDDSFNNLYKTDVKTSKLILIFSLVAIVICALGLFGLATFTAEQRTKEIGIRKVLGASVQQITLLLSKDFLILVSVAIVVASPIAWWVTSKWLQDFAYRISPGAGIFIAAGALALMIAVLSVSIQAIKTALANPVKALRSE